MNMYLKFNLLVLIFYIALNDGKLFRFDYDFYQDAEGWLKLHEIPATWTDARLRCFREGAVMASPENENMLSSMTHLLRNFKRPVPCGVLTGVSSAYSKGDFYSISGTPLARMPVRWAPEEPDNADDAEGCLLMLPNGTHADVNCSAVFPYICYKQKTKTTAVTSCGTVDPGYALEQRTGSCYKFHAEPQTWPRAFAACSGEGGHLAIINSDTESQVLKQIYAQHPASSMPGNFIKHVVHIGHSDWGDHGLWMTVHGQTLKEAGFDRWSAGQPDNSSGQFCGAMFANGHLDDVWCNRPCPFICEKSPDSLLGDEQLERVDDRSVVLLVDN